MTTKRTTETKAKFKKFPTVIEANNNTGKIYEITKEGIVLAELDQNIIIMCEDLIFILENLRADLIQTSLNKIEDDI